MFRPRSTARFIEAEARRLQALDLAEKAALAAIPRVYKIKEAAANKDGNLRFLVFGCHGDAKTKQKQVAELLEKIAADPKQSPPDFILILGDNFYDDGVATADDPCFHSHFYTVYEKLKIPCFVILGNHDENLHHLAIPTTEQGVKRGMHQVAHSYFPTPDYPSTQAKQALYNREALDLAKLPKWNMPSRAYSIVCDQVQIFCIDSNTYVSDYLKLKEGVVDPTNQAYWLQEEVKKAKAAGRKVMLALHHPLVTPGKRAYNNDIKLYLSKEERQSAAFNQAFSQEKNSSYNTLMRETLKQQQLKFDTIFTAHDHDMYYYNNTNDAQADYKICQITSGGGGGDLQDRFDFSQQHQLGCFMKRHGVVDVSCSTTDPTKETHYSMMTVVPRSSNQESYQLKFTSASCVPIRSTDDPKIKITQDETKKINEFCEVVKSAIDSYFAFLAPHQDNDKGKFLSRNLSHGTGGVERAHDLWNYISNSIMDNLCVTIKKVGEMTGWTAITTSPTNNSLITLLNKKIEEKYGKDVSIENVYEHIIQPDYFFQPT